MFLSPIFLLSMPFFLLSSPFLFLSASLIFSFLLSFSVSTSFLLSLSMPVCFSCLLSFSLSTSLLLSLLFSFVLSHPTCCLRLHGNFGMNLHICVSSLFHWTVAADSSSDSACSATFLWLTAIPFKHFLGFFRPSFFFYCPSLFSF